MKNITAIGEIIFDVYPGYKKLGGAPLNFIFHIQKLTGHSILISRVGDDAKGRDVIEFLKANQFPITFIQVDSKHATGIAKANLDRNKIPHWDIPYGSAYDFIDIPADQDKIIENTACFYFGSLAQRMNKSQNTIQSFFGKDIKYFFDMNIRQNYYTREILESSLNAADILKVNEEELVILYNMFFTGKFERAPSIKGIMEKFNIELAALTLGDNGAWLFNSQESSFYKSTVTNIVDTTGAGDAYSAMLCLGYLDNMKLDEINRVASEFAAKIIQVPGAIPCDDTPYKIIRPFLSTSVDSR